MTTTLIGKPMLWNSLNYGTVAVHVAGMSLNGEVAVVSIDGSTSSTQCRMFAELADGIGFAILGQLSKRPSTRKPRIVAGTSKRQLVAEDESHVAKPIRKRRTPNPVNDVMAAAGIVVF